MTQEEVIEMAREVYGTTATEQEIRFANLVAAKEREACAKVVDDWSDWHGGTELIAAVIRERGQA